MSALYHLPLSVREEQEEQDTGGEEITTVNVTRQNILEMLYSCVVAARGLQEDLRFAERYVGPESLAIMKFQMRDHLDRMANLADDLITLYEE